MDVVKWLAFAAAVTYAAIVAAMYVGQRSLLFPLRPELCTAPARKRASRRRKNIS